MNDQERSQLLLEQEKSQDAVSQLQSRLKRIGEKLSSIGNALQKSPSEVTFIIATGSISQTGGMPDSLCFNTDDIPTWLELQSLTQSLRDSQRSLQHTQTRLGT